MRLPKDMFNLILGQSTEACSMRDYIALRHVSDPFRRFCNFAEVIQGLFLCDLFEYRIFGCPMRSSPMLVHGVRYYGELFHNANNLQGTYFWAMEMLPTLGRRAEGRTLLT